MRPALLLRALKRMMIASAAFIAWASMSILIARPAQIQIPRLFGECFPQYASNSSSLKLYTLPDLESDIVQLPYKENWLIPYSKSSGVTRVVEIGQVRVSSPEVLQCSSQSPSEISLQAGELVDYLYYLGEGYANVAVQGLECYMFIENDEVVRYPVVQVWIRVLYADGSSPGWLLNDFTQTKNVGVLC